MSKVTLRDYLTTDWQAVHDIMAPPETHAYEDSESFTIEQAKNLAIQLVNEASLIPKSKLDKAIIIDDSLVGMISLHRESINSCIASLACALNPAYKAQGYATEAVHKILSMGFSELKLAVIYGICEVSNRASARVMEKVGMTCVGFMMKHKFYKGEWKDYARYEITVQQYNTAVEWVSL